MLCGLILALSRTDRQRKHKLTADILGASLHPNLTAVRFDCQTTERQAQAEAAPHRGGLSCDLGESLKDPFALIGRNAGPGIGDC